MNPVQPQATPVPIHDITGPVWFFPYSAWTIIAAAVGLLAVIGLLAWIFRRKRKAIVLTPKERALRALADLRREGAEADSYAFGVKVSDALRRYIRDQFGLDATTRTSVEFLESIRENLVFSDNEKAALSEFLESADLLKYARVQAGGEEIQNLLSTAERLVRGEENPVALK